MKIVIFGMGTLGTVFETLLKRASNTVYALTKEKYLKDFKNKNVRVTGIWGNYEAVLDGIYSSINPLQNRSIDPIFLTVKSYDTVKTAK
jgi:2-dehydropantoate 2-reductase